MKIQFRHACLIVLSGLTIATMIFLPTEAAMSAIAYYKNLVEKEKPVFRLSGNSDLSTLDQAFASTWINTKPLNASQLKGKVVLIEFWTYSCINWRRTLPNVRAWSEKYKDQGLVVIGVHTPEFAFEHDLVNVKWATTNMKIDFPVVIDNDFALWRGFKNQFWPAMYFIDGKGRVRHTEFGEGNYDKSEKVIQALLKEAGFEKVSDEVVSIIPLGAEVPADWANLKSNENYLGYGRTENFASGSIMKGKSHYYHLPGKLFLNQWSLSGDWTMGEQSIVINKMNGKIHYRFHARDLHIVMGTNGKDPVRFRILLNGKSPDTSCGSDVDGKGNGVVDQQRMYQLIRQPGPVVEHLFEIEFLDPGAEVFSFTFG